MKRRIKNAVLIFLMCVSLVVPSTTYSIAAEPLPVVTAEDDKCVLNNDNILENVELIDKSETVSNRNIDDAIDNVKDNEGDDVENENETYEKFQTEDFILDENEPTYAMVSTMSASQEPSLSDSGTCGNNLQWAYENGTLTIFGDGEMIDYRETGDYAPWWNYHEEITRVIVESGVTSIGSNAFVYFGSLTSVELPDGLKTIGDCAFEYCGNLASISLPDSVDSIGYAAFLDCTLLTSFIIPSGVTEIKNNTFDSCRNLTQIIIPNTVTRIEDVAFGGCSQLESISLPSSVESIGAGAFNACASLKSIELPQKITSIGPNTFNKCKSLESISIPDDVTFIGSSAFNECSSLTNINLPSALNTLEYNAFKDCSELTQIDIPSGVTTIPGSAFEQCTKLREVSLHNNITSIGSSAFRNDSSLEEIILPTKIKKIGWGAFENCGIRLITTDDAATCDPVNYYYGVEKNAFKGCNNLVSVKFPGTLGGIFDMAFENCPNLETVEFLQGFGSIGSSSMSPCYSVFYECPKLKTIILPDGIECINYGAFLDCTSLTSVDIPNTVSSIRSEAFKGCTALTGITIPSGITGITGDVFSGCTSLGSINLPNSITKISEYAFYNCTSLKDIYFDGDHMQWNNISIDLEGNDVLDDTTIHCTDGIYGFKYIGETSGTSEPLMPARCQIDVPFSGSTLRIDWGTNLFKDGAYSYKKELAIAGLVLSAASEDSESQCSNILEKLGFKDVVSNSMYDQPFNFNLPACSFGSQEVSINDEKKLLVCAVIRGTQLRFGDIFTDLGAQANGFVSAGENTSVFLRKYIEAITPHYSVDASNPDNILLYVTGHSLGGATAGRLAQEMSEYSGYDTFVYTYASPNYTVDSGSQLKNNVFNVINSNDYVPSIPFGYGRIGKEKKFCASAKAYLTTFKTLTGQDHLPYPWTSFNAVTGIPDVLNTFGVGNHDVRTYMSYLLYSQNSTTPTSRIICGAFRCPVDIDIYDDNDNLIGRIRNNVIDTSVSSDLLELYVYNDEKFFTYYGTGSPVFKIYATDSGTLTYDAITADISDSDVLENSKTFSNVVLEDGKEFYSVIEVTEPVTNTALYVINPNTNEAIMSIAEDGSETPTPAAAWGDILPEDRPTTVGDIPTGLWAAGLNTAGYTFTGSALTPEVRIYHNTTILSAGTDYSINYERNTNAYLLKDGDTGFSADAAPSMTITGLGTYAGSDAITKNFVILKKNLADADVIKTTNSTYAPSETNPILVYSINYNGSGLTENTDYTMSVKNSAGQITTDYHDIGNYAIIIEAAADSNFTGTCELGFTIRDNPAPTPTPTPSSGSNSSSSGESSDSGSTSSNSGNTSSAASSRVLAPALPYGTITGLSANNDGSGSLMTLNATTRDIYNQMFYASYYAAKMGYKTALLDTKELYAPYGSSAKWRETSRVISWKDSRVNLGEVIYAVWYCQEVNSMMFIPCVVTANGTIYFAAPCLGSMSIVSIVKLSPI